MSYSQLRQLDDLMSFSSFFHSSASDDSEARNMCGIPPIMASNEAKNSGDHFLMNQLTPEEANRIIHSHRKVRYGTACWPCRQRKVKCDNKQPCENCVKREHTQLCSYKPNRLAAGNRASHGRIGVAAVVAVTSPVALKTNASRKRARSMSDSRESTSNKSEQQESWSRVIAPIDEAETGADRYLGQNSIPALLREQSSSIDNNGRADIKQDMRSILGLDTSAPFPLMSAHHLHHITQDIFTELPSDREVMKLFRTYKEIPQAFWGFVMDIDDFETKLMVYLEDRSRNATNEFYKSTTLVTASWLAILFAMLAVGSQYHESPYHIRTQNSQKYIQTSFHLLRVGNFLLRPSFDSIQALLLTSFVLLNDMKAEGSWALLGLTCRLAQSLGLHMHRPSLQQNDRASISLDPNSKEMVRRKLWWTVVWHDTLTSLSFDRSPMTNFPSCSIPLVPNSGPGSYTYLETMYHLIEIISRRLNPDMLNAATYAELLDNCETVEALRSRACPHIRDKNNCKTALDRLQYFAIRLHTSFIISVSCRPALSRDCKLEPSQKKDLSAKCKTNLAETVRMFLAMHQLSVIPTRSWAFTYHGLSSALLLGILCETKADPEVRQLQGDLIAALSATAVREAHSPKPYIPMTNKDIELSGPLSRALTALRNIYEHGTISGSKKEADTPLPGSGARTPLPARIMGTIQRGANVGFRNAALGSGPREDAALTMAEMQNGRTSHPEFTGCIYSPQPVQSNIGLDILSDVNMGTSQYMAPMDLYDTIWGASTDEWNTGVDALGFDFLAQAPPGQSQQQFYF